VRADHGLGCDGQAVLIAEPSNSRVILSLTRTPPFSTAPFQVMAESLRLMKAFGWFKAALAICAWACQPEINEDLGARS